jgi:hypothetical protein
MRVAISGEDLAGNLPKPNLERSNANSLDNGPVLACNEKNNFESMVLTDPYLGFTPQSTRAFSGGPLLEKKVFFQAIPQQEK